MPRDIIIYYSTIDHFHERRKFATLAGARAYARRRIGTPYNIGTGYAVDMYGTGKIEVRGATLEELLEGQIEGDPPPRRQPDRTDDVPSSQHPEYRGPQSEDE